MRTESREELQALLNTIIAAEDELHRKMAQWERRRTGRPPVYALSIKDFPPSIRDNPDDCLRFLLVDRMRVVGSGEYDTLTLDELSRRGTLRRDDFEALKKSVEEAARGGAREGAKSGVETTLPKVYAKTANMSDEELREATQPKTRAHGGGRKKERDLDDAQVKAVLADMKEHERGSLRAHCDYIIKTMKDGMYKNPYRTANDLDKGVRRYCKRTNTPLVYKTKRTGKWRRDSLP